MIAGGTWRANSEAIFGSAARGLTDVLSDTDYLIVDDCPLTRSKRKFELEAQGWSIASYNWTRLKKLSEMGALFVQHLRDEALIVHDESDRLRHQLSRFNPKPSYAAEVEETKHLIALSTSDVKSSKERAWASDVLAVTVRNLAILTFAERGHYEFDYANLIDLLSLEFGLNHEERRLLLKLRMYKSSYRKGQIDNIISQREFENVCWTLSKSFGGPHYSDFPRHTAFSYPGANSPYLHQRLVERDLLMVEPATGIDDHEFGEVVWKLRRIIVSPRDYAWQFSVRGSDVWSNIEWLRRNTRRRAPELEVGLRYRGQSLITQDREATAKRKRMS